MGWVLSLLMHVLFFFICVSKVCPGVFEIGKKINKKALDTFSSTSDTCPDESVFVFLSTMFCLDKML